MQTDGVKWSWDHVILGEPASKANSRKVVRFGKVPRLIKSDKARAYVKSFADQCLDKVDLIVGSDCCLVVDVWYASRRSDLACLDLIQDCLQGIAYLNDRCVKSHAANWMGIDPHNPRAHIKVRALDDLWDATPEGGFQLWR